MIFLIRVKNLFSISSLLYFVILHDLNLFSDHLLSCCVGQIVFSSDEKAGYSALYHLLRCSVTDDFETRTKAVTLLVG